MPKTKQNNGLSYTEGFDAWTAGKSLEEDLGVSRG